MPNGCENRIYSEDYVDLIIKYGDPLEDIEKKLDVCISPLNYNAAVVYTPIANLPKDFFHWYGYGAIPNCFGLLDIASTDASNITRIRSIPNLNLRGQGVLIGIVDTGIDYTHEAFKSADGTSKIFSIWDQTIDSPASHPMGFNFGTEYTQSQINTALANESPLSIVPSNDVNGHGTFMAGIIAGSTDEVNNFTGIVPDAQLVIVKMKQAKKFTRDFWRIPAGVDCFGENDFIHGFKYLIDVANREKKPISITIGIGTSQGAHDDRGSLSSYLSTLAAQTGVAISIAAGNEGNRGHHYYGTIQRELEYDTVELKVGANESGFSMEFWGTSPFTFSFDILSPTGEYIPRIPARLNESREIRFIFEETVINIDYQLTEALSGEQMILVRFTTPAEGIWRFRVYSYEGIFLNYHIWLPIHQFIGADTYFIRPNNDYTLTSPGNTLIPIVTTAYNYRTTSLYLNASRGYLRNQNIAPALAAPGVNLIGPIPQGKYNVASGTSVAAAHTAGAAAMFLEWGVVRGNYMQLSSVEIKNLFIRGAKRDPTLTYPNKEWGYGILDLYNAYNSLRSI